MVGLTKNPMIKGLGCFHFVEDYSRPIESLDYALGGHDGVSGSLIILPEAFNNGKFYWLCMRK
jgi:hypothetical protein